VLLRPVPIGHDRSQAIAISSRDHKTYALSHGPSVTLARASVNPLYASVH
jgi:hypothetical protein